MGGKAKAPPPPDYSAVAAASERSAELSFQLGQEQLAWAKEQYASDKELIERIVEPAITRMIKNDEAADRDRARYEAVYQPVEDMLVEEAKEYASPERTAMEMERAQSTVAQNFEGQRMAALKNLESYGVDPSATRFAALDAGSRVAEAAAKAGAGNQARVGTEAMGRALRSEAINVGRGYPGQVAGTYATALQSGNQAANSQLAATQTGASTMGTPTQWFGAGNQAIQTWGNTLNMEYNNQLAAADFNSRQSSGIGALAGAALGAIGNAGGLSAFFDEGGPVPEVSSPTRGAAIDDVNARLTPGEFVVPKEAVSWYGERHFQKLIEKADQERQEAPAKPEYRAARPGPTTFRSGGALPVG
jgi:hypothetical protein